MTDLGTDDESLDKHTQEYRRRAAEAAADGRRAAVLCAPYTMVRRDAQQGGAQQGDGRHRCD